MKEERLLILTMLQEGKITAEEAAELLAALARTPETQKEKTLTERVAEVVERVEQAREQVEAKLEAARQRIEEARIRGERTGEDIIRGLEDVFVNVERGLSRVLNELPETVGRWFGALRLWPEHTVNQAYEGEFPAGPPEAAISAVPRCGPRRADAGGGPGRPVRGRSLGGYPGWLHPGGRRRRARLPRGNHQPRPRRGRGLGGEAGGGGDPLGSDGPRLPAGGRRPTGRGSIGKSRPAQGVELPPGVPDGGWFGALPEPADHQSAADHGRRQHSPARRAGG